MAGQARLLRHYFGIILNRGKNIAIALGDGQKVMRKKSKLLRVNGFSLKMRIADSLRGIILIVFRTNAFVDFRSLVLKHHNLAVRKIIRRMKIA